MKCPRCQQDNPAEQKFCGECGTPLQLPEGSAQPAPSQQPTTSAVLAAIPSSATDVQPVLGAIARTAARLCEAGDALIYIVDGDRHRLVAKYGRVPQPQRVGDSHPVRRDTPLGRAVLDRRPVHVRDIRVDRRSRFRGLQALRLRVSRVRTLVAMPLLREGVAIGGIVIRRTRVRPFTAKQVALLKTFADQASITIENVRLFAELQDKNRALTEAHAQVSEALEQQTATSEILRVISSSPTNLEPVAQAIADSAAQLCDSTFTAVFRFDGEQIHWVAARGTSREQEGALRGAWPRPPDRETLAGRTILARETTHIHDASSDPTYTVPVVRPGDPQARAALAIRSFLGVPMLREGQPIGVIGLNRTDIRPFSEQEIALVQTFADQAVIAIESVRLFKELEARNRDLTDALEQQTATAEILRVIGTSPTHAGPVFEAIARSAVRVCGALSCGVFVVDESMVHLAATHGVPAERLERFRSEFPAPLTSPHDAVRTVRERSVFQMADIENNPKASPEQVEVARLGGYRTRLMVPMVRGDIAVGLIAVTRAAPTPFTERQVELLKTFADQAVIAIENVRLFTELQDKNRALTEAHAQVTESLEQQTTTSEILRVISSSPTDVQPVFDTIAASASRLCGGVSAIVTRFDGKMVHLVAHHNPRPGIEPVTARFYPRRPGRESTAGRAILECRIVHIPDAAKDPDLAPNLAWDVRSRARSLRRAPPSVLRPRSWRR